MWEDQARRLGFGQKRKIKHCGTDPSAYIRNEVAGVSIKCFRCGHYDFKPHGKLSAKEYLRMREADNRLRSKRTPSTQPLAADDTPSNARLWLLAAGIAPEKAWQEYGIGYDTESQRVIVPILQDGRDTGVYAARSVDGRVPKYIMPSGSEAACWYWMQEPCKETVVVEDVLSAIKIREAGFNALAVLGTSVPTTIAALLADKRVIGWFDGDKAGREGFVKLRNALGLYGVEPLRITTERDPKTYNRAEIAQFIKDATWQPST